MGASPLARQTPVASSRGHAGQPATVAFRRPSDVRNSAAFDAANRHFVLPVVLRLPDLNEPEMSPAASFAESGNPLVGKAMWVATGVLAIVAVWLVATGKQENPETLPAVPQWNAPDRVPSDTAYRAPAQRSNPFRIGKCRVTPERPAGWTNRPHAVLGGEMRRLSSPAPHPKPKAAVAKRRRPRDLHRGRGMLGRGADRRPKTVARRHRRSAVNNNPRETLPSDPPLVDPTVAPGDPWPGEPQWPDDARRSNPADQSTMRTARRPAGPGSYSPQRRPEARLEGGIQNMDVGPQP